MRRLQKKRLMTAIEKTMTDSYVKRNFVGVDFDMVRLLAVRSREAYTNGKHIEAKVDTPTEEFIRSYLTKVFTYYWGLKNNEFAIYSQELGLTEKYRVQIVFHSL